jgi:hypothetical protein
MAHLAVDSRGWTKRGEGEASRARERGELNERSGAAGPWDGDKCPSQRGRIECDSRERTAESEPSREASSSLRRGLARTKKQEAQNTPYNFSLAGQVRGRAGGRAPPPPTCHAASPQLQARVLPVRVATAVLESGPTCRGGRRRLFVESDGGGVTVHISDLLLQIGRFQIFITGATA